MNITCIPCRNKQFTQDRAHRLTIRQQKKDKRETYIKKIAGRHLTDEEKAELELIDMQDWDLQILTAHFGKSALAHGYRPKDTRTLCGRKLPSKEI